MNKIKRFERKVIRGNLLYEASKKVYDFKKFQTIKSFDKSIHSREIDINEGTEKQSDLLEYMLEFNNKTIPKSKEDKEKKRCF